MLDVQANRLIELFYEQHDITCNQKYSKTLPYSFHLKNVVEVAKKFNQYIPKEDYNLIRVACAGHDLIEDARLSYNDIAYHNQELADIIYLCTELRGKDRDERKPKEFYEQLATNKYAVFVKLCDFISNYLFSVYTQSSFAKTYSNEYYNKINVYLADYRIIFPRMFAYMDAILELNQTSK